MSAAVPLWLVWTALWVLACYLTLFRTIHGGYPPPDTRFALGSCLMWTVIYLLGWVVAAASPPSHP